MEKQKTCMFTGHRDVPRNEISELSQKLDAVLEKLIGDGYTDFCTGGAIGFDTIAALKVIEKREKYGFIRLHLMLPCREQELKWSERLKSVYYHILEKSDSVSYSAEHYINGCMQIRNRKMADVSSACVAYCTRRSGGTYYTLKYAQRCGLKIINI